MSKVLSTFQGREASENAAKSYERVIVLLKQARTSAGLKQYEVADALGVEKTGISRLESGTYSLSVEKLFVLCELYDIDPEKVIRNALTDFNDLSR